MPFTTPLALLGLLFVPAVVAMYLLKLRRNDAVVPSTLLWRRLVSDVEANAPWQRLRRSPLLLVQLLLVVLLALLAARPFLERPTGLARDIVLVIDTSASMGATDVSPNRLAAAKSAALEALKDLPNGGKVSVIAAGRTARVIASGTSDLGRIRQAVASIEPTSTVGDLGDAFRLASALAARSGDAEILVATDVALARDPTTRLEAPVRVLQVGREPKNQAIAALAVRSAPSGLTKSAFISVANLALERVERRLELYGDGSLLEARDVRLDPLARADVVVDDITQQNTRHVDVLEVRLVATLDADNSDGGEDRLAIDDRAWAVVPPDHLRRVLLVTAGDPYLETALSYLPNTELYGISLDKYGPDTHPEKFDLIIFEGELPVSLPTTPVLAIAPAKSSPLGEVTGVLKEPPIGTLSADEPLLRYVDLSTTHIAQAQKLVLPDWARTVIPGPGGAPLLYAGERAGIRTAVLAFEPRRSDLPLQVAFPILIANLSGELMGASGGPTDSVSPGRPVTLNVPSGASGLRVTKPDGTSLDLVPGTVGGQSVVLSQTDDLGVYTAVPIRNDGSPSPTRQPTPSPTATRGTGASGSPPPDRAPSAPIRFAVNLFDVDESTIAPGEATKITGLRSSGSATGSAAPSVGDGGTGSAARDRPAARDELWIPILLAVIAFLCVEWAIYQRDGVVRLARSARGRMAAAIHRPADGG